MIGAEKVTEFTRRGLCAVYFCDLDAGYFSEDRYTFVVLPRLTDVCFAELEFHHGRAQISTRLEA